MHLPDRGSHDTRLFHRRYRDRFFVLGLGVRLKVSRSTFSNWKSSSLENVCEIGFACYSEVKYAVGAQTKSCIFPFTFSRD